MNNKYLYDIGTSILIFCSPSRSDKIRRDSRQQTLHFTSFRRIFVTIYYLKEMRKNKWTFHIFKKKNFSESRI